jgi:hypothetical protein
LVKLFSKSLASGLTVRQQLGYVYKRTRYVPIGKPDREEVEAFRSEETRVKRGRLKAPG